MDAMNAVPSVCVNVVPKKELIRHPARARRSKGRMALTWFRSPKLNILPLAVVKVSSATWSAPKYPLRVAR